MTGTIYFNDVHADRALSDLLVSLTLRASLHTSIPSSSGVQVHADNSVYCSEHRVDSSLARHVTSSQFAVPFSITVPTTCPISTYYRDLAKVQHDLELSITDLSTTIPQVPIKVSEGIRILSRPQPLASKVYFMRNKKVTCTTSQTIAPGKPLLLQVSHPETYEVAAYSVTLTNKIKIRSGSASFVKETQRSLEASEIVLRRTTDGNHVSVLEVACPESLEKSIEVPGLRRNYTLTVSMSIKDRPSALFSFAVEVCEGGSASAHAARNLGDRSPIQARLRVEPAHEPACLLPSLLACQESTSAGKAITRSSHLLPSRCPAQVARSTGTMDESRHLAALAAENSPVSPVDTETYLPASLFSVPRKAPVPTAKSPARQRKDSNALHRSCASVPENVLIPEKSPLRKLSVSQLGAEALFSDLQAFGVAQARNAGSARPLSLQSPRGSISSRSGSDAGSSISTSSTPGTPKSSASSASSFSSPDSSYFHQKRSSTSSIASTTSKHKKRSSLSSFPRNALSLSKLTSRLSLSGKKEMEFSCCGKSPTLRGPNENFQFPARCRTEKSPGGSPSSTYSAVRDSITDSYFQEFKFDGLSSLDDAFRFEEHDEAENDQESSEESGMENLEHYGLAL